MRLAAVLAFLIGALAVAGCGGDKSADSDATQTTATGASPATCEDVEAPEAKPDGGQTAPTGPLDRDTKYVLAVETSCGDFEITLDQKTAPNTAASLVALAKAGFFDETVFHRVVPAFVVQGGDPTGTGTGGAGYQTIDEPAADAKYLPGTVAMAKSQVDPRGAASSQFFVVTGDASFLAPDYAIVGEVTTGMDAVMRIDALGDAATQMPTKPVVLERMTVRES